MLSKRSFEVEITPNKKEKLDNLDPTACFTNAVLHTGTVSECVWASYWRRTPVVLTALKETTEMEY